MKNLNSKLLLCFMIAFSCSGVGFAQDITVEQLDFKVFKVFPPLSISKENLKEAKTIADLNKYYKPAWVKEFYSVEVMANSNGQLKNLIHKNGTLTQAQKDLMETADVGKEIKVKVKYLPENNLKTNEEKELLFAFNVSPENDANFANGPEQLNQYLKTKAIDKIGEDHFEQYAMASVRFTVNEEGEISDVNIFTSSEDEKVDELLLTTVSNMPCWKPAEFANGTKVKQEFVLAVGSMENCMLNTLNLHRNLD